MSSISETTLSRINVPAYSELPFERVSELALDVQLVASRVRKLGEEMRVKAMRGDKTAARLLAALNDDLTSLYAEAVMDLEGSGK